MKKQSTPDGLGTVVNRHGVNLFVNITLYYTEPNDFVDFQFINIFTRHENENIKKCFKRIKLLMKNIYGSACMHIIIKFDLEFYYLILLWF